MDEKAESESPYQLTIACLLVVTAGIALILAIAKHWEDLGGLSLAIPFAFLPFSILVEFASRKTWKVRFPTWRQFSLRLAIAIPIACVPAVFASIAIYDQSSWWSPVPHLLFLTCGYLEPFLMTESVFSYYAICSIASTVFFATVFPIFIHSKINRLPIRSIIVLSMATLTSFYWFSTSIELAFDHHSPRYIYGTLTANILIVVFLWAYWAWFRLRFTVGHVLTWNAVLSAWLFWVAHPWLG